MSTARFSKAVFGLMAIGLMVAAVAAAQGPSYPPTPAPTGGRTPMALQVLNNGNIMIAGVQGDTAVFMVGYSPAGAVVSNVLVPLAVKPLKMAINPDGMVAVAAVTTNNKGDIWVQKFVGGTGFPFWWMPAIYNGPARGPDKPINVGFDNLGNVFVSGETMTSGGYMDPVTMKLDTITGSRHWVQVRDTGMDGSDAPVAMAFNPDQDVQIASKMWNGTDYDYSVNCYAGTTGLAEWPTAVFGSGPNAMDVPTTMTEDKWDHITISGFIPKGNKSVFATLQYDCKTGALRWGPSLLSGLRNAMPTSSATDSKGNILISGVTEDNFGRDNFVTVKYHLLTGREEWRATYGPFTQFNTYPIGVVTDANNDVFVAGVVTKAHFFDTDFVAMKYSGKTGARLWGPVLFDYKNNSEDVPVAAAVDAAGNFYMTGVVGTPIGNRTVTVKYDGATGNRLWFR